MLASLSVRVELVKGKGEELIPLYPVKVGEFGKTYPITFVDLMNLIRTRQGFVQRRLEYKPQ
jgi:hypothetical protein